MDYNYPIYVIDTNILIDYADIIEDPNKPYPENSTIDLSGAHLAIPTAVIRELSKFKKERTERGKTSRNILRRLRNLAEDAGQHTMNDFYKIKAPMEIKNGNQTISIVPVHKDFYQCLPYLPSEEDMDGQIILATLSIAFSQLGAKNDGDLSKCAAMNFLSRHVMLLTNDNGLAIRAHVRGIPTSRYGYHIPPAYTGRRDLEVPYHLFAQFIDDRFISIDDWNAAMPKEPPLIANEFIVMSPQNGKMPTGYSPDNDPYFLHIGRYDLGAQGIVSLKFARGFPTNIRNAGQAIYAEALMCPDIDVIICTGPAGTGKTFMATIYAYNACKKGEYIGITVIPCQVEDDGVGFLPGDLEEKLDPNVRPIKNALRNFLIENDKGIHKQLDNMHKFGANEARKKTSEHDSGEQNQRSVKARLENLVENIWENWFDAAPIAYARGRDFSHEIAFYDEFQDQNRIQADTLLKRLGKSGKIIITGDIEQIHSEYLDRDNNGLTYARQLLKGAPMVAQVQFSEDEIVRHSFVKLIAKRQSDNRYYTPI